MAPPPGPSSKQNKRSLPSSSSSTTTSTSTLGPKRSKLSGSTTSRAPTTTTYSQQQYRTSTTLAATAKSTSNVAATAKLTNLAATAKLTTCSNAPSIDEMVFNEKPHPAVRNVLPDDVRSTATRSSHLGGPSQGDNSIPTTVVAHEDEEHHQRLMLYGSMNASDFERGEVSAMDKAVVQHVVTEQFFPEVKFFDKDTDLAWEEGPHSFCQFFITKCKVPLDVDRKEWWLRTKKLVAYTMTQTRNDRTTAVKNAFVGKSMEMLIVLSFGFAHNHLVGCL